MVKHGYFKTCKQSRFYKSNRAYADNVATLGNAWASPYALDPNSVKIGHEHVTGTVLKLLKRGTQAVQLPVKVVFIE